MKKGILMAVLAYVIWGFIPIYFKWVQSIPSTHILAHRIIWSFAMLLVIVLIKKQLASFLRGLTKRIIVIYSIAAVIIGINWYTYVWSVTHGFILESSLGYFINPLVSVILGVLIFKEKLRPAQWIPVGIAVLGVLYLTISLGSLPWISLILAVSFGSYGMVKKMAPLPSLQGLVVETALLLIPSLAFLLFNPLPDASGGPLWDEVKMLLLLILSGPFTAIPLWLFSSAAPIIPLSTIGLLQYIAPTLQFIIGIFIFKEPFPAYKFIGFAIIWLALIIYTAEGWMAHRRLMIEERSQS